jgi:hypothetical protein
MSYFFTQYLEIVKLCFEIHVQAMILYISKRKNLNNKYNWTLYCNSRKQTAETTRKI